MLIQSFPEDARPHVSCILCISIGPASHEAPPILPVYNPILAQGDPPLHQSCGSLEGPSPVSDRRPIGTDLKKEDGHDKCLQLR